MLSSKRFSTASLLLASALVAVSPSISQAAGVDLATALPAETVGYLYLPDVPDFQTRWGKTHLGEMGDDPLMQPFIEQLSDNLERKLGGIEERLGVDMRDFNNASSGAAVLAMIGPVSGSREKAAVAVIIDTKGLQQESQQLFDKMSAKMAERKATLVSDAGSEIAEYAIPADPEVEGSTPSRVWFGRVSNYYVASEDGSVPRRLAGVLSRKKTSEPTLASVNAYKAVKDKAARVSKRINAQVIWFVDPFGYDAAVRTFKPVEKIPDKKDRITILREQGFDAIKGMGGVVVVSPDSRRDFLHHTVIYAPPKPGATGASAAERYELALRMFEMPNTAGMEVESWTPADVASYKTVRIDLLNAFDHVGSLFSAFAGYENAFETTLDYFKNDPYGPAIDLREDIVAHLGDRMVVMTDYTTPITPESERYLMVFEATNPEAIREPLGKWMENDGAVAKEIEGVAYWEIVPEEELNEEIDPLLPSLDSDPPPQREERVLRRAAVCLNGNQLVVGSDVEFLKDALFGMNREASLRQASDLTESLKELKRVAPGDRSAWTFSRTDQTLGAVYVLIRQGKMPESQSFFGRLLNRMLTKDEDKEVGEMRKQRVDGTKLPPFEQVQKYFGPSARSFRSDQDGWVLSGVILRNQP